MKLYLSSANKPEGIESERLILHFTLVTGLVTPYLLPSFRNSLPFLQEKEALGDACGRHSMMASPPLWISVVFFNGFLEKSGGEAERQDTFSI